MNRTFIVFVFAFFITACGYEMNHNQSANEFSPVAEDEFQGIIEQLLHDNPNARGIMLHVESPDLNISWTGATGQADTNGRELELTDPVLIASNTKTYVAAAIMRLIELGEINLHQSINELISERTDSLLLSDKYDTKAISVAHLMSHTSGIFDYVETEKFQSMTVDQPDHEWSKWEQMVLAVTDGDPLGPPELTFRYADMNYLLLTEIIELETGKPFYVAMRELLEYEELGLKETWFNILEEKPEHLKPFAHQFASKLKVDSYSQSGTFDLYGGGGIASTARDMALFYQALFAGDLFDRPETLQLMHTAISTRDSVPSNYFMGFDERPTGAYTTKGHGGFWGTVARYNEKHNTTISVVVLERDTWTVCFDVVEEVLKEVEKVKS